MIRPHAAHVPRGRQKTAFVIPVFPVAFNPSFISAVAQGGFLRRPALIATHEKCSTNVLCTFLWTHEITPVGNIVHTYCRLQLHLRTSDFSSTLLRTSRNTLKSSIIANSGIVLMRRGGDLAVKQTITDSLLHRSCRSYYDTSLQCLLTVLTLHCSMPSPPCRQRHQKMSTP